MATFLFASIPIPAHTRNALPFAARLVDAGHEVLWYAARGFHDVVADTGAIPLPYRDVEDPTVQDRPATAAREEPRGAVADHQRCPSDPADAPPLEPSLPGGAVVDLGGLGAVRAAYARVFVGQARQRAADIGRILASRRVDAVLTDTLSYGVGMAASLAAVPWATFGDGPLAFPEPDTPPFGTGLRPMKGPAGRHRNRTVTRVARRVVFAAAQACYERTYRDLSVPGEPGSIFEDNVSPYLHVQGATPGFEYPRRALPAHVHWVGALRPDPPKDWQPPPWWADVTRGDRPVVLVSQGTIRADVRELIAPTVLALTDRPVLVVATTGLAPADVLLAHLGPHAPPTLRVARYVPYDLLLPHVDVFVTNGGYTGVTLALAHGVPLVQAGASEEKADIGARIAWSGVGISIRRTHPRPASLRRAVDRVMSDPCYRTAAARIQREMAGHDAGHEGAQLLLRLARTRLPVPREPAVAAG